jgi:hypothetical protein
MSHDLQEPATNQFASSWRVRVRSACWPGVRAELVAAVSRDPHRFEFRGNCHFVAFGQHGARREGETIIDGAARSTRRDFFRSLVFVPSGMKLHGWSVPEKPARWLNLYIEPTIRFVSPKVSSRLLQLEPRLHVTANTVWATGEKLAALVNRGAPHAALEAETLCSLLMLELSADGNGSRGAPPAVPPDVRNAASRLFVGPPHRAGQRTAGPKLTFNHRHCARKRVLRLEPFRHGIQDKRRPNAVALSRILVIADLSSNRAHSLKAALIFQNRRRLWPARMYS